MFGLFITNKEEEKETDKLLSPIYFLYFYFYFFSCINYVSLIELKIIKKKKQQPYTFNVKLNER